jgi:cell wall-associated NlpC family hydrolase
MDCSAFSRFIMREFGLELPRTVREQAAIGRFVPPEMVIAGDLIFFDASQRRRGVDHVGIYLGGGRFVHSLSPRGVVVDTLADYRFPVVFGRRLLV